MPVVAEVKHHIQVDLHGGCAMGRHRAPTAVALDENGHRLVDGDQVPVPGYPESWEQRLLRAALIEEETRVLPAVGESRLVRPYVHRRLSPWRR